MTLKLVAQYTDACNVFGDLETIKQKFAVIKDHCATAGRDYESIHRTAGTFCSIAQTDEQARATLPAALLSRFGTMAESVLVGSPDTIHKRLAAFEAARVHHRLPRLAPGQPGFAALLCQRVSCLMPSPWLADKRTQGIPMLKCLPPLFTGGSSSEQSPLERAESEEKKEHEKALILHVAT